MSLFLPSQYARVVAIILLLWGIGFPLLGQEEEEEPDPPPPEPLEKLVFVDAHFDGVGGVDGLDGSYDMVVSPDGAYLYVASMNDDAIAVFARNIGTGELTFLSRSKNGEGGIDGLNGSRSLDISPDGAFLYVVSMFDDALVTFSRNQSTGALAFLGRIKDGEAGVDGLNGARSIAISPDGRNLYVAGWDDNALALFSRDLTSGAVSFLGRLKHGEDGIYALDGPHFLTVSPDGENVYVALWDEDAVSVYNRNLDTGILTYNSKIENGSPDAVGTTVNGLEGPRSALASPDGDQLYVVAWNDDSLTTFNRDTTGALEFVDTQRSGIDGVEGLDGAHSLAMSADGKFIYVAAFFDDAITVFSRDTDLGTLVYDQTIYSGDEGVEGLNGSLSIMTSPDGEHVYSTSTSEKSLVSFRRELVIDPPVFTVEPVSKSIPSKSDVSFHALAEGIDVVYQWMADGVPLAGATDPVYSINPVAFELDQTVYSVEASNPGGSIVSSNAILTVLPEVTLETPKALTAVTQTSNSALLNWEDVAVNETGFSIQRKIAGGNFDTIAQIFADKESYLDTSLQPGTEYIYRLRATRSGEVSAWSNEAVIESFDRAPNAPANLKVTVEKYNRIEIQWSDRSAVEDGFIIERQNPSLGGSFAPVGTVETSVTRFLDRTVTPESDYAYRVKAFNESGASHYSNSVNAQTVEIPVTEITPTSRTVSWRRSSQNFVSVTSDADWEAIANVSWLNVQAPTGGKGFGSQSVSYRVLENPLFESRIGSINIGGLIHTVTQEAAEHYVEIAPSEQSITHAGGSYTFFVSSNTTWNVSTASSWLQITSATIGSGSRNLTYTATENLTGGQRVGIIFVNDAKLTVFQSAGNTNQDPPLSPEGGGADSDRPDGILVTWEDRSDFELGYIVERTEQSLENWIEIARLPADTTSYLDTDIVPGVAYTYRVTAFNEVGASDPILIDTDGIQNPPVAPVGGGSDSDRVDGILITWEDRSDFELGYIVERTNRDLNNWIELARLPANTTSYLDRDIVPGVAYTYRVSAFNENGVSSFIYIDTDGIVPRSRLVNLSTRGFVGIRDEILIAGFGIRGTDSMKLMSRSVGPKLVDLQVSNTLDDPFMSVRRQPGGEEIATNNDWSQSVSESELLQLERSTGAFSISSSFKDSVVVRHYDPGLYTTLLSDRGGSTGIALLEVYEVDSELAGDAQLVNLSTRGYVGQGDSVMIGGFVIQGDAEMNLLIRGVGPGLADQDVSDPLLDPYLTLVGDSGTIAENDDWEDERSAEKGAAFTSVGAFHLGSNSRDAAMIVTLGAGLYTVVLEGASGETGIALFEIYVID